MDTRVAFAIYNDALFERRAGVPEQIYKIMEFTLVDLSVSLTPVHKRATCLVRSSTT
jgi:hypothetical protein